MEQNYRISELHVSNIKRIKMVDITPKNDLVILEGDNAQGKTSVMDSIAYLLGGARLIPNEPIRKGETEGFAQAIIGDFEITRKWSNPHVSYLKIKTKEGMSPGNPQTFLNERIGSFSLEVAELMNMTKDERIEVFKRITGLNLEDLTQKQKKLTDLRYDDKKLLERSQGELKNYEDLPDIEEGFDFDELQKERKEKEDANDKYREKEAHITELIDTESSIQIDIKEGLEKIKLLQKEIDDIQKANEEKRKTFEAISQDNARETKELESMDYWDLSQVDGKIKKSVDMKDLKFKHDRKGEIAVEIEKYTKKIVKHNKDLDAVKDERTKRISDSAVPVESVEFDGESIRYKGVEFKECSTAERIEMSIAIGIKENPKIRILLIRDGSAIGKATMERVMQLAKDNNFQIWIERVKETKGNEIYIEDGMIK